MPTQEKLVFMTDGVVNLRPVLKEDIPFLLLAINDPSVRCNLSSYLPMMEEDQEKWFKKICENKQTDIVFAIEVQGKIIGDMGIHRIDWKNRTGTTGAVIKDTEHRGKGYGTRAKMLLLNYAFYECNLHKVCSSALAFNTASLRFNEKCGYKTEGVLKSHIYRAGECHDMIITAVFREDFYTLWEAHKEKYGIVL